MAVAARIVAIAARTGIQRRDEHEVGGKGAAREGPADRHDAVFEWLAENFERRAVELGKLVEKQDAVVREADLARRGHRSATDQSRVADRVVR